MHCGTRRIRTETGHLGRNNRSGISAIQKRTVSRSPLPARFVREATEQIVTVRGFLSFEDPGFSRIRDLWIIENEFWTGEGSVRVSDRRRA